jgi:hypothetical protein
MKDIKVASQECEKLPRLADKPELEQMVCAYLASDRSWYRGRVEQLRQGQSRDLVRVRAIDFGWNNLFKLTELVACPESLQEQKVLCEKYKMADLKPKGRADGYSAQDRQRGGDWLKKTVNDRVVICSCYKQVKYAGGIMADCMVGEINLNKAALKMGFVILIPAIINVPQQKAGASLNNNIRPFSQNSKTGFNQNQFPAQNQLPTPFGKNAFQRNGNQESFSGAVGNFNGGQGNGGIDLDYTSYQGDSLFNGSKRFKGGASPSRPFLGAGRDPTRPFPGQAGRDTSLVVKKLEKRINEDKKTIIELKKTTNLDAGVKEIVRLLDKVVETRDKVQGPDNKGNHILSCLVGVAEVIDECSVVTEQYLGGIEAAEAAGRILQVGDGAGSNQIQSNTDLHKCFQQYLDIYDGEVLEDELARVNNHLSTMNPNIPAGWKLLAVKADVVTRKNLLEVAENVKNWIEGSVSREAALTANSQKEVDSLCRAFNQLSQGLQGKLNGSPGPDIPTSLDSQLGSTRQALQAELSGRLGGMKSSGGRKDKPGSDAAVLRSAWKALTALKNQLEKSKEKAEEYKISLSGLEGLHL